MWSSRRATSSVTRTRGGGWPTPCCSTNATPPPAWITGSASVAAGSAAARRRAGWGTWSATPGGAGRGGAIGDGATSQLIAQAYIDEVVRG